MRKGTDYIGVGIGAIIVNDEGKYLLAKRGKKATNEVGKWEFPGGGVEFGDKMHDTIKREMQEELGILIDIVEHLPPVDQIIPDDNQHWIASSVVAKIKKGEPKIMEPDKCDEIGWFSLEEVEVMDLAIPSKEYFKILKKRS